MCIINTSDSECRNASPVVHKQRSTHYLCLICHISAGTTSHIGWFVFCILSCFNRLHLKSRFTTVHHVICHHGNRASLFIRMTWEDCATLCCNQKERILSLMLQLQQPCSVLVRTRVTVCLSAHHCASKQCLEFKFLSSIKGECLLIFAKIVWLHNWTDRMGHKKNYASWLPW